jgi:transketolase
LHVIGQNNFKHKQGSVGYDNRKFISLEKEATGDIEILSSLGLITIDNKYNTPDIRLSRLGQLVFELLDESKIYRSMFQLKSKLLKEKLENVLSEIGNKHLASSITCINILLAIFERITKRHIDGNNGDEDVVILSKGHAAPALYVVMKEYGLLSHNLLNIGKIDSPLQTHVTAPNRYIKVSTGSLGQGLSIANGIALAAKMDNLNIDVYVVLGDGELDEGQIWEAALTSTTYKLDNIIGIIDRNNIQLNGYTEHIKRKEPLKNKWIAFGWHTTELFDPDPYLLLETIDEVSVIKDKPKMIIVRTESELKR